MDVSDCTLRVVPLTKRKKEAELGLRERRKN
jgi:hypothetical protein